MPTPAPDGAEARAHELLGVGFLLGDGARALHVNAAAARILGRSVEQLLEIGSIRSLLHPDDERTIADTVEERRRDGGPIPERFLARVLRPDGTAVPVELWVKAEVRGDEIRTYTLIHEVGELWALREGLTRMALTDPLTQLPNRLALEEHLRMAIARLERHPGQGGLLFLDVDGLKLVNDGSGHAAGDAVLRAFAERLLATLRPGDTAARLGGDEFVVLFPELDDGDLGALVERVRRETTFLLPVDEGHVEVAASIGAVTFDDSGSSPIELLALADARMYAEKAARAR